MILAAFLLALQSPNVPTDGGRRVPITAPYDAANPFARILRGELPATKVAETRDVLAFMDIRPVAPGHVLVISKRSRARNLLDIDDGTLRRVMAVARRVGRAQMAALGADGFTIVQNNGLDQSVPHFHVHVMPRYPGMALVPKPMPRAELEAIAAKLRAAYR